MVPYTGKQSGDQEGKARRAQKVTSGETSRDQKSGTRVNTRGKNGLTQERGLRE